MFEDQMEKELPKYQCHKKVHALKIASVQTQFDNLTMRYSHVLVPEDERYPSICILDEWKEKHNPQAPGYYVIYEDGYTSWSPVEVFESGYTKI